MPSIAISNRCNNYCLMCTNSVGFQHEDINPYTFENLKKRWTNHKIGPNNPLCFTGGEPTIHPKFFNIIHWFHLQYPRSKIVIVSNGRIFIYEKFFKRLLKYNNLLLEIALHGYNEKSHDAVTRIKGSFIQTTKGIHNILRLKKDSQELEIRLIITKQTLKNLDKTLSFIVSEFDIKKIRNIVLIFMEMEGQAEDNFEKVGVTYKDVSKIIPQVMAKWSPQINDLRLYHFPLCTLPPKLWPYTWRTLRGEEVMYLPSCDRCSVKKHCLGIHRDYIALVGKKEFKPPKKIKIQTNKSFYQPIDKVFK